MKELIIVGAGNAAREVLQIAKDVNKVKLTWEIKGFIADTGLDVHALTNGDFEIIGTIENWELKGGEELVCAIAEPKGREQVVNKLLARGAKFVNLIHPTVRLNDYCKIGNGNIFYPNIYVGPNASIGDYVFLQSGIAHDCEIGDFTTISGGCGITGGVEIGKLVFIANGVRIVPKIKIGDNVFISIGSVIFKNVKTNTKVYTIPHEIRTFHQLQQTKL